MIHGYGYHPVTHTPDGHLRGGPRRDYTPAPADLPIERRPFFDLLDQARAGDKAAQAELRRRGPSGEPTD